jgi:hypothetical protein
MLLEIDDNKTLGDLQENFNESFPFLKIEFYDRRYRSVKDFHLLFPLPANTRIESIRKSHDPGICTIKSWFKTGKVEEDLWEVFGLNARIFRYEGKKWVPSPYGETLTATINFM